MAENKKISVLDLSKPASFDLDAAARQFRQATRTCGFVYVRMDDRAEQYISALRQQQRLFFAQSPDCKEAISIDQINRGYLGMGKAKMHGATRTDQKEVYFWGREAAPDDADVIAGVPLCGPNQWPAQMPEFRKAVENYSAYIRGIGDQMLQIVARSLNAEADFFTTRYDRTMLRGQLLCYPPCSEDDEQFGVAPHSDFGCITLLLQETAGLEVQFPDGEWVPAPPIDNTLVINIGDLLERWSNKRLPSTLHRVRNRSGNARYSIAMFYDPNPTAVVDPTDLLPEQPALYPPIAAADYILSRNKGAFKHYQDRKKETL
jgi:isopenicillin N synthase-like dioxygenase